MNNLIYDEGDEVMHSINIRLYPNFLPGQEQTFLARTVNDASLGIKDICTSLVKRGGFKGDFKELVNNVMRYHDEVIYKLCDGYAVNTGYYTIYPNVGGTFNGERDKPEPKKNPLTIRFQPLKPLRNIAKKIRIVNQGFASTSASISEYIDTDENAVNSILVPGNAFIITGDKIKISAEDPDSGVFFVHKDDPEQAVKAVRIIENNPSKVIGIAPDVGFDCRVEVRTRFTGSDRTPLKNIRSITSRFVLEVV